MSTEEKRIWDKLSESAKDAILSNSNTPNKPSTHVNFHDVTLGILIKDSYYHFDIGDNNNDSSNVDPTVKDKSTDVSINYSMILVNFSKRLKVSPEDMRKIIYSPNIYSTHK